jgi:hypothetical protein
MKFFVHSRNTTKYGIIISLFAMLFLSSCAIYNGNITGNAQLGGNNFRYVGKVAVSNKCVYVFHWGGNAKETQITALKEELQQRYPLRNGLAWANVSIEMKTGFYILWDVRKAILTADIVDFWPDTNTAYSAYNGYYLNETTFIPVPKNLGSNTTIKQDSILQKLLFLNAQKQNIDIKNVKLIAENEINPGTQVLVKVKGKYTNAIVLYSFDYSVNVAYLDKYGELKTMVVYTHNIFK